MAPYGLIWNVSMVRENRFQVDCQLVHSSSPGSWETCSYWEWSEEISVNNPFQPEDRLLSWSWFSLPSSGSLILCNLLIIHSSHLIWRWVLRLSRGNEENLIFWPALRKRVNLTFDIHDIDKFLHRVRQVDLYIYIYEGEDFTVQIHSGNSSFGTKI